MSEGAGHQEIQSKLQHRIEKVLIVDNDFRLRGLVTVKDIMKAESHPDAAKDAAKRLLAAAVGTGPEGEDRVRALVEAGVDILVVLYSLHGYSQGIGSLRG